MKTLKNTFKTLCSVALLFSAFAVVAQDNKEAVEEVVVTGSYLKGSATDGASPVEIIGRDTIEDLGAVTMADITKNISVNSGSENQADSFTSGSTQGTSNVNLRGLGLSSTLVLVDGRRNTVAAATANDGSVFVDTNSIPVIAVKRVEVLKEGAASIYGSDAVAGVVNYILRRDFTGLEFDVSRQEADLGEQVDSTVGMIWGKEYGDTNVVLSYSVLNRSPLAGTEITKYSQRAISGFGNSFLVLPPAPVASLTPAQYATNVPTGDYAGTYYIYQNVPDANCVANKGILIPFANAASAALPGGSRCGFYYGDRFNLVNDEDHNSLYSSLKTTLGNGVNFEMDFMKTGISVNDNPQSPSYPALSYLAKPVMPGKAGSPFSYPVLWVGRPLGSAAPSPLAPREYDSERLSLGLNGTLSNGFDWDVHYTDSMQKAWFSQPDTSTSRFDAAINGVGGVSGTESWDLFNSANNSASLVAHIKSAEVRTTIADLSVLDILFTGTTKKDVNIATGFQWKREGFSISRNDASKAVFGPDGSITQQADLMFLGGGLESDESRNSTAVFVEASKDMSDKLQIKGALRYESLESDTTFNPKVSMRYAMSDSLVLRGSYSTSFREASLSQMSASLVSLQGLQDFNADGSAKGSTAFIRVAAAHNPNLVPETSDNINLGAIWTVNDQASLTVDYWNIAYEDVITLESAQGKIVANPANPDIKRISGTLVGVTTSYFNAENIDASGLDISGSYDFDTALGQATVGFNTAHIMNYEIPNGSGGMKNVVGLFNQDNFARSMPETKMVISGKLNNGNHNVAAFVRNVSEYKTNRALDAGATAAGVTQDIDSFMTVDVKYSYDYEMSNRNVRLTLGINNLLDEEAPIVWDAANFSYDPKHHDPRGKIVYMGIKISR
jgi:iron complex outermembrane receptor protein